MRDHHQIQLSVLLYVIYRYRYFRRNISYFSGCLLGVLGCGASEVVPRPWGAMGCVLLKLASSLGVSRRVFREGGSDFVERVEASR